VIRRLNLKMEAVGRTSLALVLLLVAAHAAAAPLDEITREEISTRVQEFLEESKAPGISVAVGIDHELCFEQGYGRADIENDVPATASTVYRLASISKMLTAVAVMQLVEAGKIDLAAPIQHYVEGFPEKQAPITCELLLKHQSGIRHYRGDEVRSNVAYTRVRDSFDVFQNDKLLFDPGTRYSYTTYGFNVLGAAIEGASGEEYVAYVTGHIAKPAGMQALQPDSPYRIIPHRAAGYRWHGPVLVNDDAVDVSNKIPGGGWCSTAGDLVRFANALCAGKLVSSQTLEQMWTPQKTSTGKQTDSGFGCFIATVDGQRMISHSGGQPKVSTLLVFFPERRVAVALMCNLRNAKLRPLAVDLARVVMAEAVATTAQ
jgi:CubicO group peptidase (beta-lactamase class C family)